MPYGRNPQHDVGPEERARWRKRFFRKGKTGTWKKEMPEDSHQLFWELHGHMMKQMGYPRERSHPPRVRRLWFFEKR